MPAKSRDLFDSIASFPALRAAALRAAKGKRAKPAAASFLANLEKEVLRLERELKSGSYRPGRYTVIEIGADSPASPPFGWRTVSSTARTRRSQCTSISPATTWLRPSSGVAGSRPAT